MGKLKILYSTVDKKNYLHEDKEYFKSELAKHSNVDVRFITKGGHIKKLLDELNFKPNFIYFDGLFNNQPITGLRDCNIPVGILYHDLHSNQEKFKQLVKDYSAHLIFVHYRDYFLQHFPEFSHMYRWLPHFIHTPIFKDYKLDKDIDYLLMGATTEKHYPLRQKIANEMNGVNGFVHHIHPGYKYFSADAIKTALIGENYAKEINRAKIFFTDDSIYKFPIKKYTEVLGCNTLLLATDSQELKDLGFVDRKTFVEINDKNYFAKAQYYIKNDAERLHIAENGYKMVRSRHTTEIRIHQFIQYILDYLNIQL
ncbi:glycosyltransferase [Alkalihalobacterium alkalinitrilicum]|uniref:glycosyltransferase n=1 Tax=Alkalihalobacterium alkalinitrilicum TaxID=427920 RepID=UPI001303E0DC|nr:glycosyltransferase [Alkalihalobacterium alkalinitrilicum]